MAAVRHGKITVLLLITIGAFILAVMISALDLVKGLELDTLDARFKLRGTIDVEDAGIIVVGIDDQTYEEVPERWPFPREYYAKMIRNLMKAGARMVVFDVQFTEEDYKSVKGDSILAAAVSEAGNVVLAGKLIEERNPNIEESIRRVISPIPVLMKTGAEWGTVNEPSDLDNFTRRYMLYQPFGEETYLPIGLKAFKLMKGYSDTVEVRTDADYFYYGDLKIPRFEGTNTMLVNFCGPARTFPTYSFSDILDDSEFELKKNDTDYMEAFYGAADLPPEFAAMLQNPFKDKIVLLGATIEEQKDTFSSPFYSYGGRKEKTPGVEYHANALWTILNEKFIYSLDIHYIFLIMLAFALITAATVHFLKPAGGLAAVVLELAALAFIAVQLFNRYGLWIEVTGPALASMFTFLGTGGYQFIAEQKEKRMIKGMFQHYLAKSLVDELIANPDKLKLGGDKKELTVFFSDIENFTSISESLIPEKLLEYLNEYLSAMTDIVLEYDGMLDKYIGDAIVAVWGAPIVRERHASLGCRASLQMQKRLAELRRSWKMEGKPEFKARIGLNTGFMTIGNVGSHQRLSYTVIGDVVNLASRLEGINKQYQTYIIISDSTYKEVRDEFQARELDLITVKGKTEPVLIYELLEEADTSIPETKQKVKEHYSEGLKWYRERRWEMAIDCFKGALSADPEDYPSKLYIERCRHFRENPPPDDWDGVWIYTTK
ncbi:MAG: CHASE2 domain-containing protein [candidate division Zixibacteria bacterium]|nr:CHASE2 domain-containing protein [Candidatus Tariuqbacter arcticus]